MRTTLRISCLTGLLAFSINAASFTATDGSASVDFTPGAGTVTITLKNLLANPLSAASLLSDLFFTVSNTAALTSGSVSSSSGNLITVNANGTVTPGLSGQALGWVLSNTAGVFHLDGLNGAANTPAFTIIGPAGPGGVYTNANNSIAGNGSHNPFVNQTATFILAVTNATTGSTFSNVAFSFGTASGNNVPGVPSTSPVPEPTSLALLGGVLAFTATKIRRHKAQAS